MSSQIGDLIEGVLILGSRDINLAGPWIPVYWIDLSGGTMEPGARARVTQISVLLTCAWGRGRGADCRGLVMFRRCCGINRGVSMHDIRPNVGTDNHHLHGKCSPFPRRLTVYEVSSVATSGALSLRSRRIALCDARLSFLVLMR